jgi:SMP-30/Gluconolactonase/LRE-like region
MNDSVGQKSYAFDFDLEMGSISNKRLIVDFRGTSGEPDGLVVEYRKIENSHRDFADKTAVSRGIFGWQYMDLTASVSYP